MLCLTVPTDVREYISLQLWLYIGLSIFKYQKCIKKWYFYFYALHLNTTLLESEIMFYNKSFKNVWYWDSILLHKTYKIDTYNNSNLLKLTLNSEISYS